MLKDIEKIGSRGRGSDGSRGKSCLQVHRFLRSSGYEIAEQIDLGRLYLRFSLFKLAEILRRCCIEITEAIVVLLIIGKRIERVRNGLLRQVDSLKYGQQKLPAFAYQHCRVQVWSGCPLGLRQLNERDISEEDFELFLI